MEQALLTLEIGLHQRGIECAHVTCGWTDGVFARRLVAEGISAFPLKLGWFYIRRPLWTLDSIKEFPRAATALRRLVKTYKPDVIVHLYHRFFLVTYPILWKLHQCRHVYIESVTPANSVLDRLAYRLVFSKCPLMIVNSKDTEESFKKLGLNCRSIALVENGIDHSVLKPFVRRKRDPVRIGVVGQVIPRKGHDVLLMALKRLRRQGLDFRLVVVGEGEAEFTKKLRASAIDWQLERFITWSGVIYDKQAIYEQIDVLAVPSRSEAFGLVAIEAGAAGLPVVASRVGGLQSIIVDGETGILVAPEAEGELADAIGRLITDPKLRRAMGEAGRRRVESQFGADRMADNFISAIAAIG
jgi:glycosyltransferase involved in cell wall biosynthesis